MRPLNPDDILCLAAGLLLFAFWLGWVLAEYFVGREYRKRLDACELQIASLTEDRP